MTHFDTSNGSITVNGKTVEPCTLTSCGACGKISYQKLMRKGKTCRERDSSFPAFSYSLHFDNLPKLLDIEGAFPSLCVANICSNVFLIYSNSLSNSFPVHKSNANITFTQLSNGLVIDQFSPTSSQ